MSRKRAKSGQTNLITLVAGVVLILGVAYAFVDRTMYAPVTRRHTALLKEAPQVWHDLFEARSRAARAQVNAQDPLATSNDPVLLAGVRLNDLAKQAGVKVVSITPGVSTRSADGLLSTPFTLTLEGHYPGLVRFVGQVEAYPLLFQVNGANLSRMQGSTAKPGGQVSLTLLTAPRWRPQS